MEELLKSMVKTIGILQIARYKTYASLSDDAVLDMAKLYALVVSKDARLTSEIVQKTAMRYVEGEVTVWSKGSHVPAPREFPSPSEFRDACVQTWDQLYRTVAVGEEEVDGAKVLITRVERRGDPQPGVKAIDPPATPEQIQSLQNRLSRLPAMPSLSEATVAPRQAREVNEEAERELARIRASLAGASGVVS